MSAPSSASDSRYRSLMFVAAFVLVGLTFWLTSGRSPPPAAPAVPDRATALTACRDAVRPRLTDPGSANFASLNDSTVTGLGDNRFQIVSTVDAKNALGGTVRTRFTCEVTAEPLAETFRYTVTAMQVD